MIRSLLLVATAGVLLLTLWGCQKSDAGTEAASVAPPTPSPQVEVVSNVTSGGEVLDTIGNKTDDQGRYICPVSGNVIEKPEEHPYVNYEGKTYYLWCPNCEAKFSADPEGYVQGTALLCNECEGEGHEGHDQEACATDGEPAPAEEPAPGDAGTETVQ